MSYLPKCFLAFFAFAGLFSINGICDSKADSLKDEFNGLLDTIVSSTNIPGALLAVHTPALNLDWEGAAGVSEIKDSTALNPDAPLRIASNTKTYVAAAILRLVEEDRVSLDDGIIDYLSQEMVAVLAGDGYSMKAITIRHLLSHTAGFFDHAQAPKYIQSIMADPQKQWTPDLQIRGCVNWGDPLAGVGEVFLYSDTGYILLGQVLEKVTGKPLGVAVRELLDFEALGLETTWWEINEQKPGPAKDRAHQYLQIYDTHDWNPSLDSFGGGGLVATVEDLRDFWRALFTGKVFKQETTLQTMFTTPIDPETTPYRLGIFVRDINDLTGYEHSGFWGTVAVYVPELDATVAAAVTRQEHGAYVFKLMRDVVGILQKEIQSDSPNQYPVSEGDGRQ